MLTEDELTRYDRQIMLKGIGRKGQEKLKKARVFVAGAGGLGSPISIYLAAAGVGTIRLADHDTIEMSNLNRQILYGDGDIGKRKIDSAVKKLQNLNKDITVEAVAETITEENVSRLVGDCDLIVDAMDNLPTRYVLNRAAIEKNIPFFHGAVYGFEGRATTIIPGKTACLWCIYQGRVTEGRFPVIGVAPAVIGCLQATEVIKYITGIGELLTDQLLIYDGLNLEFTKLEVKRDPHCQHCGHLQQDRGQR
ncbi:MAG: HesA/MoeB/ThiF family protein [Dehalococcoidales bacterium]|nr:HesA/MoeB/ThiF family protein [Dehalococcoidales bacterium]